MLQILLPSGYLFRWAIWMSLLYRWEAEAYEYTHIRILHKENATASFCSSPNTNLPSQLNSKSSFSGLLRNSITSVVPGFSETYILNSSLGHFSAGSPYTGEKCTHQQRLQTHCGTSKKKKKKATNSSLPCTYTLAKCCYSSFHQKVESFSPLLVLPWDFLWQKWYYTRSEPILQGVLHASAFALGMNPN